MQSFHQIAAALAVGVIAGANVPARAVAIAIEPSAAGVVWRVEDSGPGLDNEQRSRLGERFFRVLGSGQPGSGLGWSIVRRIAERSGAQVRLGRSGSLGGLQVELVWPVDAAHAAR